MNTVEQLTQALEFAKSHGFEVRFEYLLGHGSGACCYGDKRWLFVDLALSVEDQLDAVQSSLSQMGFNQQLPSRSKRAA